jgi:hypothetical protein
MCEAAHIQPAQAVQIFVLAVIHDPEVSHMRKIITIAVFLALAAVTTAWSTSMLPRPNPAATVESYFGGASLVPTRSPALW